MTGSSADPFISSRKPLSNPRLPSIGLLVSALLKSARRMRVALPGAPLQRRAGGGTARRVVGMDADQFGVRAGSPVDKPRNPHADLAGRDACKARKRGVVFSWVLVFWTSKREVPRPPQEDESSASMSAGENPARPASSRAGSIRPPQRRIAAASCFAFSAPHSWIDSLVCARPRSMPGASCRRGLKNACRRSTAATEQLPPAASRGR